MLFNRTTLYEEHITVLRELSQRDRLKTYIEVIGSELFLRNTKRQSKKINGSVLVKWLRVHLPPSKRTSDGLIRRFRNKDNSKGNTNSICNEGTGLNESQKNFCEIKLESKKKNWFRKLISKPSKRIMSKFYKMGVKVLISQNKKPLSKPPFWTGLD